MKKVAISFPQVEFYNQWGKLVMELNEHIHRKRMQASVYSVCKVNLKESEAILHANYS